MDATKQQEHLKAGVDQESLIKNYAANVMDMQITNYIQAHQHSAGSHALAGHPQPAVDGHRGYHQLQGEAAPPPVQFQIKSEIDSEDQGLFYDHIMHGFSQTGQNASGMQATQCYQQNLQHAITDNNPYNFYHSAANLQGALNPFFVPYNGAANTQRINDVELDLSEQATVNNRQFAPQYANYRTEDIKRRKEESVPLSCSNNVYEVNSRIAQNGELKDTSEHDTENVNKNSFANFQSGGANSMYYSVKPNGSPTKVDAAQQTIKTYTQSDILYKTLIEAEYANIKGEYSCWKCNAVFPSKKDLKQHCKKCEAIPPNMTAEEISDMAQQHSTAEKIGKFTCDQCPYKCQSPAILKIHERTHSGEKPYSCNFCEYKSGQKNNVAKHILVHMKEKPFRCQYCQYRCAQKNNLVVHERTHTGFKPFACTYCEYKTVQKPNLVKHMYLHTNQKPFGCDVCSYRCVQKTNLMKHKQKHLNEKYNGSGDYVQKSFSRMHNHSRVKPFVCDLCPYKCVLKSSWEKHRQTKHALVLQTMNGEIPKMPDESPKIENVAGFINFPGEDKAASENLAIRVANENNVLAYDDGYAAAKNEEIIQNLSLRKASSEQTIVFNPPISSNGIINKPISELDNTAQT